MGTHSRTQHSLDHGRQFSCDVPGCSRVGEKAFTTQHHVDEHKWTHHSKDIRRDFSCDVLGCWCIGKKAFTTLGARDKHKRIQHPKNSKGGRGKFQCNVPGCPHKGKMLSCLKGTLSTISNPSST